MSDSEFSLAESVIERVRSGQTITESEAEALNHLTEADRVRALLSEADVEALLALALSPVLSVRYLALNLLQPFSKDPRVLDALPSLWRRWPDYKTRSGLIYRLLDHPALSLEMHRELYSFVREHWARWLADTVDWYGEPGKVLPAVQKRLSNPAFPASKAWIYLCHLAASDDREGAKRLIAEYEISNESIVGTVAQELSAIL
jgi:hypothetical protein